MPSLLTLPDGRSLAYDDVGDHAGRIVLYVHGGPDSRLGRHPDDGVAERLGVRLIAVDRPGSGRSSVNPDGTFASFAADIAMLTDHLGASRFAILAWSAGAMFGLACAARRPAHVTAIGVVGGLPSIDAYDDPAVMAAAPEGHRLFAEMARELDAHSLAAEVAPMMLPSPLTIDLARAMVTEGADGVRMTELSAVPGAIEQLARSKVEAVSGGLAGLTRDLELQATPADFDLADVSCRVHLWYGTEDRSTPPAFGRWLADRLPRAAVTLEVIEGAGHTLLLPRWSELLSALVT